MRYENLTYHKKNNVIIINFSETEKHLSRIVQIAQEIDGICTAISIDKEIQVVIFNWEQEKPLSEKVSVPNDLNCEIDGIIPGSWAGSVAKLEKPVIMTINGYAIGQALELSLACDIRIASKISHFGLPYIDVGIIPWDGGTQRLSRLIGQSNAMELILTGEIINADEAYRVGLVNKIIDGKDLLTAVMEMAHKIAEKGPIALQYIKEAIYKGMDLTMDQGLRLEADLYFLLHTSRDRTEGIRAFQEKREAQFKGE